MLSREFLKSREKVNEWTAPREVIELEFGMRKKIEAIEGVWDVILVEKSGRVCDGLLRG